MTIATGCGGSVNGESQIRSWTVDYTQTSAKYSASNTECATGRLPGVSDWSGSYEFYGVEPAIVPGEGFTFTGYGATKASGTAIGESLSVTCDIEGGGVISGSVNFAANGALTFAAGTAADVSAVDMYSSVGCKIELDTVEVADVRTYTFTVTRANPSYSSSSTSGGTRRQSGVLDATGSYTVYQADFTALPAPGDIVTLEMFVNATDAWVFKYCVIAGVTPVVDIETAAIIGATINWEWSGYDASGTQGVITPPSGVDIWP